MALGVAELMRIRGSWGWCVQSVCRMHGIVLPTEFFHLVN